MALATRENSGLVVEVDRRGRMTLHVHGHRVSAFSVKASSEHGELGHITVDIPAHAVTFVNTDNNPIRVVTPETWPAGAPDIVEAPDGPDRN